MEEGLRQWWSHWDCEDARGRPAVPDIVILKPLVHYATLGRLQAATRSHGHLVLLGQGEGPLSCVSVGVECRGLPERTLVSNHGCCT